MASSSRLPGLVVPPPQFAPRIPDLKHRRLYSFGKPSTYPALEPMIAGRINVELIRAHWSEILRIIASIRTGTVTASLIMRQLASHPRQNGLAAALRELGRMARTLFMYVTWNPSWLGRRHGDHRVVGRALADPGSRAHLGRLLRNARACARGHPRSAMPDRKLVMPSSWAYVPPRSVAGRIAQIACGKATK
jgi:hypothetical protein